MGIVVAKSSVRRCQTSGDVQPVDTISNGPIELNNISSVRMCYVLMFSAMCWS